MSQSLYRGLRGTVQDVSVQLPGQVKNIDGGGNYYLPSTKDRIRRFLILGSTDGTYYQSSEKLTDDNIRFIRECANDASYYILLANQIVEVSDGGLAYKNDPAIVALAELFSSELYDARSYAELILPKVCRIGTHILHLASYIHTRRGWGRLVRRAITNWYNSKSDEDLAFQMAKYQSRDGWSHADVIRLAHIKPNSTWKNELFRWAMKQQPANFSFPMYMAELSETNSVVDAVFLIKKYKLTREMIPTKLYKDHSVIEAMIENMGMTAVIRNLGMFGASGWLDNMNFTAIQAVISRLPRERLQKERVHPLQILIASKAYSGGVGASGITWKPSSQVVSHLDYLFEYAWQYTSNIAARVCVALDVSGSMQWKENISNGITPLLGGACIAKQVMAKCPTSLPIAFSNTIKDLPISGTMPVGDILKVANSFSMGSTNPGAAMEFLLERASKNEIFDCIIFISDNELNVGRHPINYIEKYRKLYNKEFKVITINMVPTPSSLVPANDKLCLGISGFDASMCSIISSFLNGEI